MLTKILKPKLGYIVSFVILLSIACRLGGQLPVDSRPNQTVPTKTSVVSNPSGSDFLTSKPPVITLENAAQVVEVMNWKMESINYGAFNLAFSPDDVILAAQRMGKLYLWRISDRTLLQTINNVKHFAFSPDGQILATDCGASEGIVLWNIKSWSKIALKNSHRYDELYYITFSPDSHAVITSGSSSVSGNSNFITETWSASDGASINWIEGRYLSLSPDKKTLASITYGTDIYIRNISDGQTLSHINVVDAEAAAFSPDGQIIAISSPKGVELWRVSDGTLMRTLQGTSGSIPRLIFLGNGDRLAGVVMGTLIKVWQLSDGTLSDTSINFYPQTEADANLLFTLDGQIVASDRFLHRITDGEIVNELAGKVKEDDVMIFSWDRRWLAFATTDDTLHLWAAKPSETVTPVDTPTPSELSPFIPGVTFNDIKAILEQENFSCAEQGVDKEKFYNWYCSKGDTKIGFSVFISSRQMNTVDFIGASVITNEALSDEAGLPFLNFVVTLPFLGLKQEQVNAKTWVEQTLPKLNSGDVSSTTINGVKIELYRDLGGMVLKMGYIR